MYNAIIVDDELVALNALKNRVNWEKYQIKEVFLARSMKQAQEIYKKEAIDLMLCDIEMPNGSGLDLFEWVKNFFPQVECIYISCHQDYQYIRKAMKLGSFDYMLKPVDYEELNGLLEQVVLRLGNKVRKQKEHSAGPVYTSEEIEACDTKEEISITEETAAQIQAYIQQNLKNDICVNDIASYVHLNPIYVMRLFKAKTGNSIVEYITLLRIERAKELLQTTALSVQKVAEEVGYDNYSYFTRLFKKKMKLSPNQFRKEVRG